MTPVHAINTALSLAAFVPSLKQWLYGEKAEDVAQHVLASAQKVTKQDNAAAIQAVLQKDSTILKTFRSEVMDFLLRLEETNVRDRQDARARDLKLTAQGLRNFRGDIMVAAAAFGLIMCVGLLGIYHRGLPGEAIGILSTIAGIFGSCLKDAYAFEFGSSRGSKEKDAKIMGFLMEKILIETASSTAKEEQSDTKGLI